MWIILALHLNRAFYYTNINVCIFSQTATTMAPTETFSERVEQFRHDFTDQLMTLLRKIADVATLSTSERFINLIYRQVETISECEMKNLDLFF